METYTLRANEYAAILSKVSKKEEYDIWSPFGEGEEIITRNLREDAGKVQEYELFGTIKTDDSQLIKIIENVMEESNTTLASQ
jgi:hypothetical protein